MTAPALWLALAALSLLAMLFVLVPLLRFRRSVSNAALDLRAQKNHQVFAQRVLELDAEVQQGIIAPDEIERMKTELQRAFLRDMETLQQEGKVAQGYSTKAKLVPLVFMLAVPVLGLWLYREGGSSADLALPELLDRIAAAPDEATQTSLFSELAAVLQTRFAREPDDLQNAYMLGQLYEELERYEDALGVFRQMESQMEDGPDKATVLGQIARTQYNLSDAALTPEIQQTLDQAVALNPNEYYAMSVLANDAFVREDLVAALGYWRRQLSSAPPGSQQASSLQQVIAMVETYIPDQAEAPVAAVTGPTITVVIDLDPALREQLAGKQSLFIYVRNPDVRPPLWAQNLPIPEFPFTITLDSSMAVPGMSTMSVESSPTLLVGARLSASGNAIAASGDLQTVTAPFVLAELEGPLTLTIDQAVP